MRMGTPAGVVLTTMSEISSGVARLAGDKRERKFMIVFEQAGRIDHVAAGDGVENAWHGDLRLKQLGGIGLDLELGNLAALQHYHRHAVDAVEARFDGVVGQFPERRSAGAYRR